MCLHFPTVYFALTHDTPDKWIIWYYDEAVAYLRHPILGVRLRELADIILGCDTQDIAHVMGNAQNARLLQACMTLFKWIVKDEVPGGYVHPLNAVFNAVLAKYFDGREEEETVEFLRTVWLLPRVHEVLEQPPPRRVNQVRRFFRAMRKKCGWTRLKEMLKPNPGPLG